MKMIDCIICKQIKIIKIRIIVIKYKSKWIEEKNYK